MKTMINSALAIALASGLLAGGAHAGNGFLHDVKRAQFGQIAVHHGQVAGVMHAADAMQAFGNEGGVLDDIWQAHFAALAGHDDADSPAIGAGTSGARDFLTDVRRSQFRGSDV